MGFKDLSEEQGAKVAGAITSEDILRLAQEEAYERSDEELEQVVGGFFVGEVPPSPPRSRRGTAQPDGPEKRPWAPLRCKCTFCKR